MKIDDLLKAGARYGVMISQTIHHEGDERSRRNPGHGYPAYSETLNVFKRFSSKEEFDNWVKSPYRRNETFTPIIYFELNKKETVEFYL